MSQEDYSRLGRLEPEREPRLENLVPYKEKIETLLSEYGKILSPKIIEYEVEKNEFPVEILNEIRAIYSHLFRASISSTEDDIEKNVDNALSHSKRAIRDGYKFLCVAYEERYVRFFERYRRIHWEESCLHNQVIEIEERRRTAVRLLREAKEQETVSACSVHGNYLQYEKAYLNYVELNKLLNDLEIAVNDKLDVITRFPFLKYAVIILISLVIGVVLGYWGFHLH